MLLRYNFLLSIGFRFWDFLVLNLALVLSGFIKSNVLDHKISPDLLSLILVINFSWFTLEAITSYYETELFFVPITKKTFNLLVLHFSVLIVYFFLRKEIVLSRIELFYFYLYVVIGILVPRYLLIFLHQRFSIFKYDKRKVIIIGNGNVAKQAAKVFSKAESGYLFVGFFDDGIDHHGNYPLLGKIKDCLSYANANDIREIYSTILPASNELLQDLVNEAERSTIRVKFIPDFNLLFKRKVNLNVEYDIPVISFRKEPLEVMSLRLLKRAFDLLFSLLVCICILSWLVPIIAILIKLSSKGPIFFIQKRSGRNGHEFSCFKFRSMQVNGIAHEQQATKGDNRITKVGKFIRKSNLDELPQFFNVLLGDMSIVGPRPHMLKHTEQYSKLISKYMVRHFLKPGITGLAQVNGYRGETNHKKMEARVEYDIAYIENWSFWLDIKIILKTVYLSIFGDEKAY